MKSAKDVIGIGIGSMVGHQAIGALGAVPGMPAQAQTTANIAHTGINLAATGQLAKTGMDVVGLPNKKFKGKKHTLQPWV